MNLNVKVMQNLKLLRKTHPILENIISHHHSTALLLVNLLEFRPRAVADSVLISRLIRYSGTVGKYVYMENFKK